MALYALGDLHLGFQVNKPMDRFGKVWKHHERKIEKYVNQMVKPEDTLVLTGDHSWGRKLEECREDLAFIERLPGHKILLRGNHDMFWDAKKTQRLNEAFEGKLFFLQNNFAAYQDYALVGTKGYTFEGPYYLDRWGNVAGWDEEREEQAKKTGCQRDGPPAGILSHGRRSRISEVYYVSPLSAHQYPGGNLPIYCDCRGIRGHGCRIFPLPWGTPIWRQHPRNLSWHLLYAGVR